MKYPLIEIHSKSNLTEDEKNSIKEYWSFGNKSSNENLTQIKLNFIVNEIEFTESSQNIISIINYGDCNDCKSENKIQIANKTEARHKIENYYYYYFCSECRQKVQNEIKNLPENKAKYFELKYAFHYKLWEKLNNDELTFLKAINYVKTWKRVYKEIILLNTNYAFPIFYKLVKINLIHYYEDILTNQKKIYILPELEKFLLENKNLTNK